jgi:hypothetical protein
MGPVFLRAIVCGAAGLLAWLATEPMQPRYLPESGATVARSGVSEAALILALGGLVGLAAGALHGWQTGSRRALWLSATLGCVFGAFGATFGRVAGSGFAVSMVQIPPGGIAYLEMPDRLIARFLVLFAIGLCVGAAVGLAQRTWRGFLSGVVGGAVGGTVAGLSFDVVLGFVSPAQSALAFAANAPPGFVPETGGPGRALLSVGIGFFVGLFTAVVDRATRRAWVRLSLGRNEGKEWPLDTAQTLIGRDERAHVPLMGDPSLPALAAVIVRQGGQYVLQDPGSPLGVGHNGIRVPSAVLASGDTVNVGPYTLQFFLRGAPVGVAPEVRPVAQPVPHTPAPQPVAPGAPVPTAPTLVVLSGPLAGHRVPVHAPLEAGREAAGLTLTGDTQASRRHAVFEPGPSGLTVRDLGSTNGTLVNGQRSAAATLKSGDTVQIGQTLLRVE